jgi:hypothetical protein
MGTWLLLSYSFTIMLTEIVSRDEVRALGWVLARGSSVGTRPVASSSLRIYPR